MDGIQRKLYKKLTTESFPDNLVNLSGSEFNSVLLDIFRLRSERQTPGELLRAFESNRFVAPAAIDVIQSREAELHWLKTAEASGFRAVALSPVAPFGSCSAVGTVSQNKIISSLRGTEVVADATNMLALLTASEVRSGADTKDVIRYASVHRHLRGQAFDNPLHTPHFSVYCQTSGGFDPGNHGFEITELNAHLEVLIRQFTRYFDVPSLLVRFYLKTGNPHVAALIQQQENCWQSLQYEILTDTEGGYYHTLRFKIYLKAEGHVIDLADGGFVDWTAKLLGNRKHRLLISGAGIELIPKLQNRAPTTQSAPKTE